jgi:hypothetical protein
VRIAGLSKDLELSMVLHRHQAMTMLRLTQRQRNELSETMREFANLAAGALGLGQFVGEQQFSWELMFAGIIVWGSLVWLALLLPGED